MMTPEEKLELTPEQVKAFKSFERAYKKCKAAGIEFYTVLETITFLNGEYLVRIHDEKDAGDFELGRLANPSIMDFGFSGWADDPHFAELE